MVIPVAHVVLGFLSRRLVPIEKYLHTFNTTTLLLGDALLTNHC